MPRPNTVSGRVGHVPYGHLTPGCCPDPERRAHFGQIGAPGWGATEPIYAASRQVYLGCAVATRPMPPRDRLATVRARALVFALFALVTAALLSCSKDGRREEGLSSPAATAAAPRTAPASATGEEDPIRFDTGHGEDRRAHHEAERWVPDVEATTLQFHAGALWWSGPSGVYERPLGGDTRQVVAARSVAQFAVDGDGLYFVEDEPTGTEIQVLPSGKTTPSVLFQSECGIMDFGTTTNHVVGASVCSGIWALPKTGGKLRRIEPELHGRVHVATDGETLCYVNASYVNASMEPDAGSARRIVCLSLADAIGPPRELLANDASPLLLEGGEAYWLERAPASDVVLGGEFGFLVAARLDSGTRRQLASRQHQSYELRSDGEALYFFTEMGGLRRVRKDGSQVQTLHHLGLGRLGAPRLAIGGGYAFWSGPGVAGIYRLRLSPD